MFPSLSTLSVLALAYLAHVDAAPTVPSQAVSLSPRNSAEGPVVDLGSAGKWLGVVQNNGTVHSWKGIPFAAPPLGDLRYKAPRPLAKQNDTVQDVSAEFPGVQYGCVQFGTTSYVGVNAGPGQEDCLKLWIWAPAGAKEGDKLAVQVYSHGGGYQNSQSPNNDFSDFVGQDGNFIAVNANYRLGQLGFWNSVGLADEGEDSNAGLLDGRMAVKWVVDNIAKFGGDPGNIAIAGQSGGGGFIMNQMALYDGEGHQFQKAIPRSIQRAGAWNVKNLTAIHGYSFAYPGWLPSVDGKSLTDQPTRLYRDGKIARVPVMPGHVTDEIARLAPPNTNFTSTVYSGVGEGITPELFANFTTMYPEATGGNFSYNTNTFQDFLHRQWRFQDESLASCASPMVARAASNYNAAVYEFVFDAPQPGYPAYESATHSSDNYFLQNYTSTMNQTQVDVAYEWRAYTASFIRHSDPNIEKLDTSPIWHQSSSEYRYEPRLQISMKINATVDSAPTTTGMVMMDAAEWDRCSFWLSESTIELTHQ
ncbi:carboxylesterase [Pseudohyphozyma bogoriensis]|nr:carboxylesterase [Pseudohyphozyma bogoriensis]